MNDVGVFVSADVKRHDLFGSQQRHQRSGADQFRPARVLTIFGRAVQGKSRRIYMSRGNALFVENRESFGPREVDRLSPNQQRGAMNWPEGMFPRQRPRNESIYGHLPTPPPHVPTSPNCGLDGSA